MNQTLQRFSDNRESTTGLLAVDGNFFCFTLEDEFRIIKKAGDTRIPAGTYELKIRELDTTLTRRYKQRFDWFEFHIEITGVEDFTAVLVHLGNDEDDTAGCVTVQDQCSNNTVGKGFNGKSAPAFERWYKLTYPRLKKGEKVFLTILDEHQIF